MGRVVHVIGNGDQAQLYKPAKGIKLVCNLPPFEVENVYASCIVDFKMCRALNEGSVNLDAFNWVCGFRPHKYCTEINQKFYMKHMQRIRMFYRTLPEYAGNYTNFNCGHFATHYAANQLEGDEIHMYGFDSLFDLNMRSYTDLVLNSDRGDTNNFRLIENWRPIWEGIFKEFPKKKFVLQWPP
jgi:hypothetical protein